MPNLCPFWFTCSVHKAFLLENLLHVQSPQRGMPLRVWYLQVLLEGNCLACDTTSKWSPDREHKSPSFVSFKSQLVGKATPMLPCILPLFTSSCCLRMGCHKQMCWGPVNLPEHYWQATVCVEVSLTESVSINFLYMDPTELSGFKQSPINWHFFRSHCLAQIQVKNSFHIYKKQKMSVTLTAGH